MCSSNREARVVAFDALEADLDRALERSFDALTTPELLAMLERCERMRRRLPTVEHPLINQIGEQADQTELGGKLPAALADRLRITRGEASRRIHEAADLGPRRAMTGELLEAVLPATKPRHNSRGQAPKHGPDELEQAGRQTHRQPQPRRQFHRSGLGPAARREAPRPPPTCTSARPALSSVSPDPGPPLLLQAN
jgi:Domain of unknown function (DUF222)